MMNIIENFAHKMKVLRKAKNWAQLDLANKMNLRGHQQIYKWENLKAEPSLSSVEEAAKVLGVPSWQLLLSEEQIAEIRANLPISSDSNEGLTPCCEYKIQENSALLDKAGANRKTSDVTTISSDARAIMGMGAF